VLGLLVLDRHDEAGRQVRDADRTVRGVDRLPTGPARAEGVDTDLGVLDLDFDVFGFGQHGHGAGRRMDPALRFGRRHALHSMDTGFVAQATVGAVALQREDGLLEPTLG